MDLARQWELDLEEVHGLSDEEASIVVAIETKHLRYEELPSVLKGNLKFINSAKEGYKLLKEARRVAGILQIGFLQTTIFEQQTND